MHNLLANLYRRIPMPIRSVIPDSLVDFVRFCVARMDSPGSSSIRASAAPTEMGARIRTDQDVVRTHMPEDASIEHIDVADLSRLRYSDPDGIAVVMPAIDVMRARNSARILIKRAGMRTRLFIAEDTVRQGFIKTLNTIAARLDVRYIVYLAEDAFPGNDWLKFAHERLEHSNRGLLAFNCGKWHGRVAAFGMVRKKWVESVYGGAILWPEYKSHRADNELTVIARASDQFIYAADCVLLEYDIDKIFRTSEVSASNFTLADKTLFKKRFNSGFDGRVDAGRLERLRDEYLNQQISRLHRHQSYT